MSPLRRQVAAAALLLSTIAAWIGCTAGEAPTRAVVPDAAAPGASSGTTGTSSSGNVGGDATADGPAEPSDAGPGDAAPEASAHAPTIVTAAPTSAPLGAAFTIQIDVSGALAGARVLVDGAPATAAAPDAGSGDGGSADGGSDAGVTSLFADVPAAAITHAGLVPVVVENVPGDVASQSAPFYIAIDQADGGPVVYDFLPDNGNPTDTITVLGKSLTGTLSLSDGQGASATVTVAGTTRAWGDLASVEMATFVVPTGWHRGHPVLSGQSGAPFRAPTFELGTDLAHGGTATASTVYSASWPPTRGIDNDLSTSWFSAVGDCATDTTCTSIPFFEVALGAPTSIGRVALRGQREYASGYDLHRVRVDILGAAPTDAGADAAPPDSPVLWSREISLPAPTRDEDVVVVPPVTGARVRVTSLEDESNEPGLSEVAVFAP